MVVKRAGHNSAIYPFGSTSLETIRALAKIQLSSLSASLLNDMALESSTATIQD